MATKTAEVESGTEEVRPTTPERPFFGGGRMPPSTPAEPAPGEVAPTPLGIVPTPPSAPPAEAPPERPSALAKLSEVLTPGALPESLEAWRAGQAEETRLMGERDRALAPVHAETQEAFRQFIDNLANKPEFQPRRPPQLAPPPERVPQPLLSAVEGESPIQTISKLIQAMGLIGTMAGGLVQGDVRAGLSALTGAIQGWQLGDEARMERDYKNWEQANRHAVDTWNRERTHYQDIMTNAQLDLTTRFKLMELKGLEWGNKLASAAARTKDLKEVSDFFLKAGETAAKLEEAHARTVMAHEDRVLRQQNLDQYRQMMAELAAGRLDVARQGAADRREQNEATRAMWAARDAESRRWHDLLIEMKNLVLQQGKPFPPGMLDNMMALGDARVSIATLQDLMNQPDVKLDRLVGGMRPVVNRAIQTGVVGVIPIPEGILGRPLTNNEVRFLQTTNKYMDAVSRMLSGKAITNQEYMRMLDFLVAPNVRPDVYRSRLQLEDEGLVSKHQVMLDVLAGAGIRNIPTLNIKPLGPSSAPAETPAAPAPSAPAPAPSGAPSGRPGPDWVRGRLIVDGKPSKPGWIHPPTLNQRGQAYELE